MIGWRIKGPLGRREIGALSEDGKGEVGLVGLEKGL